MVLVALYVMLTTSLDLMVGHTGIVSVMHAAFYGVGAYATALLSSRFNAPFVVTVLACVVVGASLSLIASITSLRLREEYFFLATFGLQLIVFTVLNNWTELTRGPLGISGIKRPVLFGYQVHSTGEMLALCGVILAAVCFILSRIASSPFGRVLRAIREDDGFAEAMGKNTLRFKIQAFAVSAAVAALAGGLYAQYVTYIDPSSFNVAESILVLSMVILGGAGSPWGPVAGAAVLVLLPELLRFVGVPSGLAANVRQMFYGCLLVVMIMLRPRGLLGRYSVGR
jgi:branched-chain amino acid transport system permease protein